jgi:anti-anti-sigma factor
MRPIMPESPYHHLECPAIVLTITESQLQGDPISDRLRADLLGALERSGARHVVLDFQRIVFVSSVAFRPLLSLHRKLKEQGGRLVLCGMNERVAEVFHVTRLVSTTSTSAAPFELQADVPAAIASLYRTAPAKPA